MVMCREYNLRYKKVESDGVTERSRSFPAQDDESAEVLARYLAKKIALDGGISGVFVLSCKDDPGFDLRFELSRAELASIEGFSMA